jgi:hypothetical protein
VGYRNDIEANQQRVAEQEAELRDCHRRITEQVLEIRRLRTQVERRDKVWQRPHWLDRRSILIIAAFAGAGAGFGVLQMIPPPERPKLVLAHQSVARAVEVPVKPVEVPVPITTIDLDGPDVPPAHSAWRGKQELGF